jgi:uncharacterized repeat protein (TIGR03803 family)
MLSSRFLLRGRKTLLASIFLLAGLPIVSPAQTFTILHTFSSSDGANSQGALVQGFDGNLYGTTLSGGVVEDGSVFRMTPDGELTTLFSSA